MKKSTKRLLTAIVIVVVLAAAGIVALHFTDINQTSNTADTEKAEKQITYNPLTGEEATEKLPTRPVIFSIDNVGDAIPQSNISKADIIYEFPAEGLQTRLQAVFYSDFPEFVGPIRSVRPYFIDMVREYGAIYVAHGWSPDAKRYLHQDVVPYLNAMDHSDDFYRVSDKEAPHNSYINWDHLESIIEENGWWEQDNTVSGFKFENEGGSTIAMNAFEEAFNNLADAVVSKVSKSASAADSETADTIGFHYAFSSCDFEYDEDDNCYERYLSGSPSIDKETGEQLTFKNILVQSVSSAVLDEKGRLSIDMCAGGDAYLFTGGKVVKGSWSRESLNDRTIFTDESGRQFRLTPGKTYVEVMDQNCTFTY